jgi:DNA-binding MarR family transcriptional regulator
MLHQYRDTLSAIGVTPTHASILLYLQRNPGTYRQRIADAFGIDAAWTGIVIRVLQQKGWVRRQRALHHDSYVLLTLTQKGQKLARMMLNRVKPIPFRKAS